MDRISRAQAVVLVVLTLLIAGACGAPDDVTSIRTSLERGRTAVQRGDVAALDELIADDYADGEGRDRRAVLGMTGAWFRQYPSRHIMTRILSIDVDGDTARAVVIAAVAGADFENAEGLQALDGDVVRMTIDLARRSDAWRVTAATWADASPTDLM